MMNIEVKNQFIISSYLVLLTSYFISGIYLPS